jgi:hypothetical protein
MVARVGRHWGWVLAFGIITVLLGIIVLAWPGRTLLVVAVLFGAQLIVMGIFRFVNAIATEGLTSGNRALLALLGVLSLIIGFVRRAACPGHLGGARVTARHFGSSAVRLSCSGAVAPGMMSGTPSWL